MGRRSDSAAPQDAGRRGGRPPLAAVAALVAVPTICIALALALLLAPRAGSTWAVAVGLAYSVLAAVIAPSVLRIDEARVRNASSRVVQGFEDAAIGMTILTCDLRVVRANDALCDLLGRRATDVVGHSILEFTHPDDLKRSVAMADSTIKGEDAPLIKRYLRPDGTTVEAHLTSVFLEPDDAEPYFFSQLQDVTAQRRAERQKAVIAELGRRALEIDPVLLMTEAAQLVRDLLEADSCVVCRRLGDGELRIAAASSDDLDRSLVLHLDASQAGYTLLHGHESIVSNDLLNETRFSVPAIVIERGHRRALSVPVPERSGSRHVLVVHASAARRPFGVEDMRFLEVVANMVGGALDHAATEDELRRRALEDPLTGLANRALLMSTSSASCATARASAPGSRSCCWTSTASRSSTTRSATRSAMRCCARSPPVFARACARRTSSRVPVETSSSSYRPERIPTWRWQRSRSG